MNVINESIQYSLTIDNKEISLGLNFSLESAVSGVELEHVHHVVQSNEGVIDGNYLGNKDIVNTILVMSSQFILVMTTSIIDPK